jgi:putative cardiolipin synthase
MLQRFAIFRTRILEVAALGAVLLSGGCAALPDHVERTLSHAEDGSSTTLGRLVGRSLPADPQLTVSGFRLLPTGPYALDARVALADAAERTLDVQYYLLSNDATGKQFWAALRRAAVRGVRIRILLDDLYTVGEDDLIQGMAAYPNVEVRLFNPFPEGRISLASRFLLSAGELGRVNRRMHNKVFIADNAMSITGGRNVADEYFSHAGNENFVDLDVLSAGPLVADISREFDSYWNSDVVYPLYSIEPAPANQDAVSKALDRALQGVAADNQLAERDLLGHHPVSVDLKSGDMELHQAVARVIWDSPQKAAGLDASTIAGTVTYSVDQQIAEAKTSLLLVSPYFIPGKTALRHIKEAVGRGVSITVVTNSLAATDVPLVFAGYSRIRTELLKDGVKVYEISQGIAEKRVKLGDFRSVLGRLHAKAVVVDGKNVFIGSMNMDGRSAHENTETGIILESQTIGAEVQKLVERDIERNSYEVRLEGDKTRWVTNVDGKQTVLDSEPDVSIWTRLELDLLGPMAPEELL